MEKADRPGGGIDRPFIRIGNISVKGSRLMTEITVSGDIGKYFKARSLYVEYDRPVEKIDEGIMAIPALSAIVPVAWATGADVYADAIDRAFLDSLGGIEKVFRTWFPAFRFGGRLNVRRATVNRFDNQGHALLFSGGLDSVASYLKNKEKKPRLVSVWGADIPTGEIGFWNTVKGRISDFAAGEGIPCSFIRTNLREAINEQLLEKEQELDWWLLVSHGLVLTGLTAPLLAGRAGTLLMASTHQTRYEGPHGSHLFLRAPPRFGDIRVAYDLHELSRHEKIKYVLKPHEEYAPLLRVCYYQFDQFNCSLCEKCLRMITSLVLEDIDPADCNFIVNDRTFGLIKSLIERNLLIAHDNLLRVWEDIRDEIPDDPGEKMYGAGTFFRWLKGYDLSGCDYRVNRKSRVYLKNAYILRYVLMNRLTRTFREITGNPGQKNAPAEQDAYDLQAGLRNRR